jgi:hypothetical protein
VPFVTHPTTVVAAPILFTVLSLWLGVHGINHRSNDFDALNYLPVDSPLRSFVHVQQEYFGRIEALEFFVVDTDLETPCGPLVVVVLCSRGGLKQNWECTKVLHLPHNDFSLKPADV